MVGRGEKHIVIKGATFDISTEIIEARRQWNDFIKMLKTKQ